MAEQVAISLKKAFESVREHNNIDLVLPVLLKANLHVIVAETEPGKFDYIYTSSPNPERYCVTVSENEEVLESIKWPKRKLTGLQLLQELHENIEIVVIYEDGGDYITQEHLEWYRQQLP
ncbi:hypothetical protein AB6E04_22180 [Vibrio amylolyticus]|uniref:hypothetical protein n=1 Tax=Vibrio amylolyticus TaxID=2847292 RepID=UPI00354CF717